MIIFTDHALAKLAQRNMKKDAVVETLHKPDYQTQSYGDRMMRYKKFKKLYLAVVYRVEGADMVVITQYWVAKMKR